MLTAQLPALLPTTHTTVLTKEDFLLAHTSRILTDFTANDPQYAAHFQSQAPLKQQLETVLQQRKVLAPQTLWQTAQKIVASPEMVNGVVGGVSGVVAGGIIGGVAGGLFGHVGGCVIGGLFGCVIGGFYGHVGGGAGSGLGGSASGLIAGVGTAFSVAYSFQDGSLALGIGGTLASLALCMGVSILGNTQGVIRYTITDHRTHNKTLPAQQDTLDAQIAKLETALKPDTATEEFAKDPALYQYYLEQKVLPHISGRLEQAQNVQKNLEEFLANYDTDIAEIEIDYAKNPAQKTQMLLEYAERKIRSTSKLATTKGSVTLLKRVQEFYDAQVIAAKALIESRAKKESIEIKYAKRLTRNLTDVEIAARVNEAIRLEMAALLIEAKKTWQEIIAMEQSTSEVKQITQAEDFSEVVQKERVGQRVAAQSQN